LWRTKRKRIRLLTFESEHATSSKLHKSCYTKYKVLKGFGYMYADCGKRDQRLHKGSKMTISPCEYYRFEALWPTVIYEKQYGRIEEGDTHRAMF